LVLKAEGVFGVKNTTQLKFAFVKMAPKPSTGKPPLAVLMPIFSNNTV
jgi:hypothetical protein